MSKLWISIGAVVAVIVVAVAVYLNMTGDDAAVSTMIAEEPAAIAVEVGDDELIYGDPAAPVTIIEYASLTCPHCATFHTEELPAIKKELIETGQVRLVFRDFPLDQLALRAAMLVRCAPPQHRAPMLDVLFSTQQSWGTAEDPVAALSRIGRSAGMTEAQTTQCLGDQSIADAIIAQRLEGEKQFQIESTPSFVVGGRLYRGTLSLESVKDIIAKLNP